jgi:adenosine deaminase
MSIREQLVALPKVELHIHLEGSIQPSTLLQLAARHGVELPASDEAGLAEWFRFRDFPHFAEIYTTASSCLKTPEDLELVAREFAQSQANQGILYTEATYTADTIFSQSGIPFDEQIQALRRGFDQVKGTKVNLILDIVRQISTEDGERTAQWCIDGQRYGVVAIGLSGFELKTPVTHHAHAFATAKKAGLMCSAHAGETTGPESIREALEVAQADRIGHGVRCVEDAALVADLRDRQVHLEVNPTSNVCIGVFPNLAAHTLPRLLDEGLSVSINSDDPPFFNTSLTEELARCSEEFDLSLDILFTLQANAARNAFLPKAERDELLRQLSAGWSA